MTGRCADIIRPMMWFKRKEKGLRLSDRVISLNGYYHSRDYMRARIGPLVIPDSVRKSHWITFGGTRTGKTRILMADMRRAIRKGWNVIVLDPKMEQTASALWPTMVEAAQSAGRLKELVYVDVMDPESSVKFNPFGVYVKLQEVVEHVCAGIPDNEKVQFYKQQAKRCLTFAVNAYDYLERREGRKPVFSVSKLQEICGHDWIANAAEIIDDHAKMNPGLKDLATIGRRLASLHPDKFEEIHSDLWNVFVNLGTGVVGEIIDTEKGTEIFDRIWEGRGLIMYFYTGSLIVREGSSMVSRVFLSSLTSLVGKILRFKEGRGALEVPLLVVVDECQNALYSGVENLVDKSGGAGVWLHLAAQTSANLEHTLGHILTKVFLDNIGIQLFLNCGDAEGIGRYVAAKAGRTEVLEVWKRASELGEGSTVRDKEKHILDPSALNRLEERKFLCFLRKPKKPTELYVGFVRDVPDPSVTITGTKTFGDLRH